MFGFKVRKEGREGSVVSSPEWVNGLCVVAVVWDDHSFTDEYIAELTAVPYNDPDKVTQIGEVVSMFKPEDNDE